MVSLTANRPGLGDETVISHFAVGGCRAPALPFQGDENGHAPPAVDGGRALRVSAGQGNARRVLTGIHHLFPRVGLAWVDGGCVDTVDASLVAGQPNTTQR
jgi:hypothetical protein